MVDYRDIGQILAQTPSPEQRMAAGFQKFSQTLNDVVTKEAERRKQLAIMAEEKALNAFNKRLKVAEEKRKIKETLAETGSPETFVKSGAEFSPEQQVIAEQRGIIPSTQDFGVVAPENRVLPMTTAELESVMAKPPLEREQLPEPVLGVYLPKQEPTKTSGRGLYEREVLQPIQVKNQETGELETKYVKVATEMASTPSARYLPFAPQSQELPIAQTTANTLGDADTLLKNIGDLRESINAGKVGTTEAFVQKTFNPTSFFKTEDVAKFNSAQIQIQNMLLNLRSGAAVTPQEYERLNSEINPMAGDTVGVYLDRLERVENFIRNRVKYLGVTRGEITKGDYGKKEPTKVEKKETTKEVSQKTVVKTQTNQRTGEKRVIYSDGTFEIFKK